MEIPRRGAEQSSRFGVVVAAGRIMPLHWGPITTLGSKHWWKCMFNPFSRLLHVLLRWHTVIVTHTGAGSPGRSGWAKRTCRFSMITTFLPSASGTGASRQLRRKSSLSNFGGPPEFHRTPSSPTVARSASRLPVGGSYFQILTRSVVTPPRDFRTFRLWIHRISPAGCPSWHRTYVCGPAGHWPQCVVGSWRLLF